MTINFPPFMNKKKRAWLKRAGQDLADAWQRAKRVFGFFKSGTDQAVRLGGGGSRKKVQPKPAWPNRRVASGTKSKNKPRRQK